MDDFEEENIEKDIYTLRPSRGAFAPKNNSHPPPVPAQEFGTFECTSTYMLLELFE